MLRRNVLIFHSGALGDFVLTFPLAVAIARVFPQSRIFFITSPQRGAIVESLLRLEWASDEDGWHALFAPNAQLPPRAASLVTGTTAVFALHAPPAEWSANVSRINPQARMVAVDPRVPAEFTGHATQWMLDQLVSHRVEHAATAQILRSLDSRGLGGTHAGGGGVLIHPGAGSPSKCWPLGSFIELAAKLKSSGLLVRFVIGEVERERWTAADHARLAASAEVVEPTTLRELLQLLGRADAFVGNDSGPGHLAAIAGIPTVTLFGPTSPAVWKPLGPAVTPLQAQPIDAISVEQVCEAVVRQLAEKTAAVQQPIDVDDE